MLTIIDYQMGNQRSVINAFEAMGCEVCASNDPMEIVRADRIVLPGVGAFGEGMERLRKLGLIKILNEEVLHKKKPFLGICLGMQLLADIGYEFGEHEGLGWISGKVKRIKADGILLPHVGWNNLKLVNPSPILSSNLNGVDFYFVHSFHFETSDPNHISATCEYGEEFAAVVSKGNIFGAQFHPEKSQKAGRILLENFLKS